MTNRRHFIAVLGATALAAGCAHVAASEPREVLFVCQYGSVKSAVARELMRQRARERGVAVRVISRGLTPEAHVSAELARNLANDGLDPTREPLQALDAPTLRAADIVVRFDALPANLARPDARDWSDMPSMNNDYAAARLYLDNHIDALLAELS